MTIFENIMIGIGLSMDAFIIALSKGYIWNKKQLLTLSMFFGLFQFGMSLFGYYFGQYFIPSELPYKNILISFILFYIGIKMFKEKTNTIDQYHILTILFLSLLTSIDAFSIGISLSLFIYPIILLTSTIGIITFLLSITGSMVGYWFQGKNKSQFNKIGGIIILLYAIKILLSI